MEYMIIDEVSINKTLIGISILLIGYGLGLLNAFHAILNVSSARGAIAWVLSSVTVPYIAVPLYWVIGRNRFRGYAEAHRMAEQDYHDLVQQLRQEIYQFETPLPAQFANLAKLSKKLNLLPFVSGSSSRLLINGKQTFDTMLRAIATATDYILVQFYIVRDDQLGNQFKQALIEKAQQGVRIYFIYDEIGCYGLSHHYWHDLEQHGVQVTAFNSTQGRGNRFQINFRNHRKIVVVDGLSAFIGGLNIGDEYLGNHPQLSPWRDTHLMLKGAAVQCIQFTFLKDWYWATRELPQVCQHVQSAYGANDPVLVLAVGPSEKLSVCTLFLMSLIQAARDRLWITTPYFVPSESILTALKLAALRGVDVRILLPNRPDHLLVYLASFSYVAEMQLAGVKMYRYRSGFMHQKVMLVDNSLAGVGTINLDNRSLQLNFEIMAFELGDRLIQDVEAMLKEDFQASSLITSNYQKESLWFKIATRGARLLSPIL